jgi:hypothetical protein
MFHGINKQGGMCVQQTASELNQGVGNMKIVRVQRGVSFFEGGAQIRRPVFHVAVFISFAAPVPTRTILSASRYSSSQNL